MSDAATGKRRWRSVVAVGMVAALVFSPGGTELAVGGLGPNFVVVDNTTGRERWRAQHEQGLTLSALVWSPWGDELASAGGDVAIWDAMHGRLVERFLIAGGDALSLAYADDGNRLAVGAADGTVSQFNTDGYTPIP